MLELAGDAAVFWPLSGSIARENQK